MSNSKPKNYWTMNVIESIKTFIFGRRVKGEKLITVPTIRTVNENKFMSFNTWAQEMNVSRCWTK
jgi:hypothetical protein